MLCLFYSKFTHYLAKLYSSITCRAFLHVALQRSVLCPSDLDKCYFYFAQLNKHTNTPDEISRGQSRDTRLGSLVHPLFRILYGSKPLTLIFVSKYRYPASCHIYQGKFCSLLHICFSLNIPH